MKILHTGDWHLGKRLDRFDRREEQRAVMQEICEIADREAVDAVLVAGDLFDTYNPPIEATELLYKTLKKLAKNGKRPVVAIAGNHDSADRIEAPDPLARECGILMVGYPYSEVPVFELETGLKVTRTEPGFVEVQLPNGSLLRLLLTPYANELRLKRQLGSEDPDAELREVLQDHWAQLADTFCDEKGVNMLMAHLFLVKENGPRPEEPEDERPILHVGGAQAVYTHNLPPQLQYVAMGHLHRCQTIAKAPCPVVYSGSPLAYSFAEAEQEKFVMIVEVEPGKPAEMRKVPLTEGLPLVRQTFSAVEDAVTWLEENPRNIVELFVESDDYLKAEDRKKMHQAHKHVIGPIPVLRTPEGKSKERLRASDLKEDIETLFSRFFKDKTDVAPNEEMLDLFREVIGKEEASV